MTMASASAGSPLRLLELPARLRVPLAVRAPMDMPEGIVIGSSVARGERLIDAMSEGGPAALAPISGRIVGISQALLTNGQTVPAVELEGDFQDRAAPEEADGAMDESDKLTPEDFGPWIDRLRNAGVWADRLHSPDLLGQLHQILRRPIDTIICNLVDHDSMLRVQATMAGRFGAVLVAGVTLLAKLTGARNVWLAVEAGTAHKWWLPLRRELRKGGIDIVPVLADYPHADPTLLIYNLLRRRLRPGRLPVEQGVLMLDGISAIAVGRAAGREQPMLQTPVAVRDHGAGKSHLLVAPIGSSLKQVLEGLGLRTEGMTLLRGDVLREQAISPEAIVAGGELSFHLLPTKLIRNADPCIRCGWCALTCPTLVQPAGLLEAAQRHDLEMAERYGLGSCIECGICSHMCPSHLPLLQGIRVLKQARREEA